VDPSETIWTSPGASASENDVTVCVGIVRSMRWVRTSTST
jgi:hypothetical protein